MKKSKLYVGLDVHKDTIVAATAEEGPRGEIRQLGTISNDLHALEKLIAKLRKAHGRSCSIEVCYSRAERDRSRRGGTRRAAAGAAVNAGPCGFGIARRLEQLKIPCSVISPAHIPKRSGDRVKTDSRAERDRLRAEPQPEGCRRLAASTATPATWPVSSVPAS
jgi:transposase